MVVVRETPGVARTTFWSGSSPCREYIDSSHHDTLGYEWLLVRCCHLIVCLVYCCWIMDEHGYGYIIMMITVCTLPLTLTWVKILLVYACYSL
jgi:hypothetical protein